MPTPASTASAPAPPAAKPAQPVSKSRAPTAATPQSTPAQPRPVPVLPQAVKLGGETSKKKRKAPEIEDVEETDGAKIDREFREEVAAAMVNRDEKRRKLGEQ